MPNPRGNPTPAEAVTLREHAISNDAPDRVRAAIAIMLDHVVRLEQTIDLIDAGQQSAMRAKPPNAIHNVRLEWDRATRRPSAPAPVRRPRGAKPT